MTRPIRPKRRDEYHHGDLRRALIDAALKLIDEEGLGAVSTRALARRLGVSHAAPGHHFKDRDALLAEVASEGFRIFADALEAVAVRYADPRERLAEIGRAYLGFAAAHPAYFRVMFGRGALEAHPTEGPLRGESLRAFEVLQRAVAAVVEARGRALPVDELTFAAWSLVHGLAMLWIDGAARHVFPTAADFHAAAARTIERALDGLVPTS